MALDVLHDGGHVHTDVKPSNILVNYKTSRPVDPSDDYVRFVSTIPADSRHARDGDAIGTPIFRSPEASLRLPWGTATNIWSFGTTVISMLIGYVHIFKPKVPLEHKDYEKGILERMHIFWPLSAHISNSRRPQNA
jgi:serine/threonine protein kinase